MTPLGPYVQFSFYLSVESISSREQTVQQKDWIIQIVNKICKIIIIIIQ